MEFIAIPFFLTLAPVLILFLTFRYRAGQTRERYQTMLQLADKGVELPTALLVEPRLAYSERRRALVLIGGGLGLSAMFFALPGHFENGQAVSGLWGFGLLPLMTGLGYLASWWLNQREGARG
ncbi:hypothetical protein FHW69_001346 [Luteibacter sp. Sphag1AF]|uniref:DUF6249 domain-containing protein n=1 Tax=Luteibacter sp. Sphag1AF TaxID=2587031 RepID=UPI001619AD03|nr:DUF6249 domain-containing protein [Luteibacter sp. Sphag1AF]MBB3226756.1 hypothetical protein [Luteibacter sp. Sphag1AF]